MTRWDEIERLVHDRIDGLTSAADDAKLDAILAADPELSRRARELHDVVAGLRSLDREQAPADFTRRVMDRVEATRGASARHWTWRMAGPALMAAAAIVVAALWIGRGDLTPPTLEASAPVGSRDVWSESAPAPADEKPTGRPVPGAVVEPNGGEPPGRAEGEVGLGFVGRSTGSDAVLDALTTALRDHAFRSELGDVSKEDGDEAANDVVPAAPVPAMRNTDRMPTGDDGTDAGDAVRVILLRRSTAERKQKSAERSSTGGIAPRGPRDPFAELLPPDEFTGGNGRKAKYRDPKNAADTAGSDALSALAATHAERLRDVALDDAEFATLLRAASDGGYDAFELDPVSIGTSTAAATPAATVAEDVEKAEDARVEKDATDAKEQSKAALDTAEHDALLGEGPLRWLPIALPSATEADRRGAGADIALKRDQPGRPRRRTIVVLASDG
ncbi:MAG: hypothetical protein IT459_00245 [Planctomycetes bacterium]|nr:hypothetical protein [Planctomycetota bacterium]